MNRIQRGPQAPEGKPPAVEGWTSLFLCPAKPRPSWAEGRALESTRRRGCPAACEPKASWCSLGPCSCAPTLTPCSPAFSAPFSCLPEANAPRGRPGKPSPLALFTQEAAQRRFSRRPEKEWRAVAGPGSPLRRNPFRPHAWVKRGFPART